MRSPFRLTEQCTDRCASSEIIHQVHEGVSFRVKLLSANRTQSLLVHISPRSRWSANLSACGILVKMDDAHEHVYTHVRGNDQQTHPYAMHTYINIMIVLLPRLTHSAHIRSPRTFLSHRLVHVLCVHMQAR